MEPAVVRRRAPAAPRTGTVRCDLPRMGCCAEAPVFSSRNGYRRLTRGPAACTRGGKTEDIRPSLDQILDQLTRNGPQNDWAVSGCNYMNLKVVRKRGFEPLRYCYRQPLKLRRSQADHSRPR